SPKSSPPPPGPSSKRSSRVGTDGISAGACTIIAAVPCQRRRSCGVPSERANYPDKKKLVAEGRSHGILVYSGGEAVGWCQYGRADELPRIDDDPNYRGLVPPNRDNLWRIPCFVVDKRFRRQGVGSAALKA